MWWANGVPCFADSNRFQSSASSSGDFVLNLPANDNPYMLFMVSYPSNAGILFVSPTFYLTMGPVVTASSSVATASIPIVLTATNTITSVSQLTFTQIYGSWILAAVAIIVVLAMWFVLKSKKAVRGAKQPKDAEPEKVEPEAKKATSQEPVVQVPKASSTNCRVCGKPMRLLDEYEQRWYCHEDDQLYYAKDQRWAEENARPKKAEARAEKMSTKPIKCKICKKRMTLVNPDMQIWYCKNDRRAYYGLENRTEENVTESGLLRPNTNVPSKRFCIECGSELPLKSKFCNNCGTKQP
jgi:hypothetical protein